METIAYDTHPGGAARFDRQRRQPYDWTCLWCFERSPVDPMAPGRCPHCDTEFWSRHRDYGPTPASYYTSDPAADPDRLMAIVRHEEGWRWMIVRDLDGHPVCKGPPAQTEQAAERHLHQFLRRVREGKLVLEDLTDPLTKRSEADDDGNGENETAAGADAASESGALEIRD